MTTLKAVLLAGAALLGAIAAAHAANPPAHVLLISIDGMHEVDLRLWVQKHPGGPLAKLSQRAPPTATPTPRCPPTASPGMLAQVTGGTPASTGVFYDDSFDRTLYADQTCTGAQGVEVEFAENIDVDPRKLDAGGTLGQPITQIDVNKLRGRKRDDGTCVPVYPHDFVRVNTIFEVLRAHGQHTAWADKHPAYDLLNGPSGAGVEDLYTPEINAQAPNLPAGKDNTTAFHAARDNDALKVAAIINQIDGLGSTGQTKDYTPALYGMNFQAVSVGQKLTASADPAEAGLADGYVDAAATPGAGLAQQLQFVDDQIGKIVDELTRKGQFDATLVIVSAKHGQSPIDRSLLRRIPDTVKKVLANDAYAFDIADDAVLVWLDPAKRTEALYAQARADLLAAKATLGIIRVIGRKRLTKNYRDPFTDARTPDFIVLPAAGVVYTSKTAKIAEHGGGDDDDRHVALLVSAPGLQGNVADMTVFTTQIAPTILAAMRIAPDELQAVRDEGTQALPGLAAR